MIEELDLKKKQVLIVDDSTMMLKIYQNQFKRRMPLIAKLTSRSINHDFNYPRDVGL